MTNKKLVGLKISAIDDNLEMLLRDRDSSGLAPMSRACVPAIAAAAQRSHV